MKSVFNASVMCLPNLAAVLIAAGGAQAGSPAPASSGHGSPDHGAAAASGHETKDRGGHHVAASDAKAESNVGHGGAHGRAQGSAHWGYGGKAGPGNWGRLSKDYHLCRQGAEQSPIDIGARPFDGASDRPVGFDYRLSPVELVNNDHTIQVNYAPGSAITVRGVRFELLQAHFHTPSELAVIGVMMHEGDENLALSEFWALMPAQAGETRRDKRTLINPRDLLPPDTGYYRYMGSLTTPPCSEGVNWYVMASPVTASAQQVQQFAAIIDANARPVQPTGKRLVLAPLAAK